MSRVEIAGVVRALTVERPETRDEVLPAFLLGPGAALPEQLGDEQLLALGIPSEFSYVWLPDEASGKHQFWATWTSEEDGEPVHRSRALTYDLDKSEPSTAACFAAWESDEPLFVDFVPPADVVVAPALSVARAVSV